MSVGADEDLFLERQVITKAGSGGGGGGSAVAALLSVKYLATDKSVNMETD